MPWPTFKTRDEIPDAFRAEYEEREGQFVARVPDIAKVEETLGKVRTEKKEAEKAAKEAGDRAADLQRQLDAKSASGADTDKKMTDMLAQWNKDKEAAVAAVQAELDATKGQLRTVTLDDKLKALFLENGGRSERAAKALHDTKDRFDLVDGQIVMKNEKGEVTTEKPAEFFAKTYRAEVPEFYAGTKATGGGATGGASRQVTTSDSSAAERVLKNPLAMLQEANAATA